MEELNLDHAEGAGLVRVEAPDVELGRGGVLPRFLRRCVF